MRIRTWLALPYLLYLSVHFLHIGVRAYSKCALKNLIIMAKKPKINITKKVKKKKKRDRKKMQSLKSESLLLFQISGSERALALRASSNTEKWGNVETETTHRR